mmetsp:Transcript_3749/g.9815  ORF Transcript_3749/g.9815 Transcript_3749/m.9815 type:complete len:1053 (-) Transcript_3749:498-3656(-)|eukprot:CAMPEP_0197178410 /NCGR_PEP_ID=MMETSP1423-20130617/3693_1 /TAXON_ID=476441 /ORGANISM="Pseudo-nitzschia heimii, Strain UNC1101" /LENGTH=1052 /DNA_ID=CAMNT_0042628137 /DNA_START=136 /DNA_END=3294 /DNA_ORIENTATION=-
MKRVDTRIFVVRIATALMAILSPSATFSVGETASLSLKSSQRRDLFPSKVESKAMCCKSCEYSNDGGESVSTSTKQKAYWEDSVQHETSQQSNDFDYNHNRVIRILTWAETKPELQKYANLYRQFHPEAPVVRIFDVPSLKELDFEILSELRLGSTVFDAFVVPPLMMGGMARRQGLAIWTEEETLSLTHQQQKGSRPLLEDLLPYYRYNLATYGDKLLGLPILSGSQALILFRKDYLDALNLPTPKTWEDWTVIASKFRNGRGRLMDSGLNVTDKIVYGACLGLLNEAGCRRRNSLGDRLCKSQTMTYLGMILASMTQYMGNSTGYMMEIEDTNPNGMYPLFQPSLERVLKWMEKHIENSTPHSLREDSFESMKHFRDGRCAWTISVDHDSTLFQDHNIGFVPLPGSHQVLDRSVSAAAASQVKNCTANCGPNCQQNGGTACPYGHNFRDHGLVNQVPFGAVDGTVATVSALVSQDRQREAKKFFTFVLGSQVYNSGEISYIRTRQPLTRSVLRESNVPNYEETMISVTSSPNTAIPFRVPNAFNLLSDLDNRIYDYLIDGNYSDDRRNVAARAALTSLDAMISMYDSRTPHTRQPTFMSYKLSLGVSSPTSASDLYIGWVARGIIWILAGLSCLVSVCFALWVWTYQHERVVRASQPVFLYLVCAGTFVMALSVFTLGVEDDIASYEFTSATCMASYWLYVLGFTAVISAMFAKMWMLGQVFQKPRNEQRIQITKQDILVPFFVIFGLDCIVLATWTILDRQRWVRMPMNNDDSFSLTNADGSTVGWCTSTHSIWYTGLLVVFNIAILLLSLVQSYECRRITTEYAESAWVTIAIVTTAQAWFISLPLVILSDHNPTKWFVLRSSTVLCTTFAILLLIFIPKIIYSYEALKKPEITSLNPVETKKKLFNDEIDRPEDNQTEGSFLSTKGSSLTSGQKRQDPKGTIGIRIVQFTFLDSDEVDELEDAVYFAEQRNKELKDTMDRLKDNLEEHKFTRGHVYSSDPRYSFRSKVNNNSSERSVISVGDIGSIIEAKPDNLRHSRLSRRDTYLS